MKGFGNIMKEAQKLQAQMEQLQAEAAKKTGAVPQIVTLTPTPSL